MELQGDDQGFTVEAPLPMETVAGDFLKDIRRAKRLTQAGVYSAVFAIEPIYYVVLGLTLPQVAIGLGVGLAIATVAIEGVFHQMFKLGKRSAYPGAVALQLGSGSTFDTACQATSAVVVELLHLAGSFLALRKEGGYLSLVAISGVSRVDADRYLRLGAACIQRALAARMPVSFRPDSDLLAGAALAPGSQVVFVPVQSFVGVIGVMGLVARDSNADLRDRELLASLGMAIGVGLESLRQRDDLRTQAAIDELTNVYNRRHFFDQMEREIAACRRYSMPVSVLTFDLDRLKELNDGFGHAVGDEALRTLAQRMVRYSRASDIVCRLGGDEFAVILPRTSPAEAADIRRRLQSSVEDEPLATGPGHRLKLSVSCGQATFPADAEDVSVLLRAADGRMYAAKAARARGRRN